MKILRITATLSIMTISSFALAEGSADWSTG